MRSHAVVFLPSDEQTQNNRTSRLFPPSHPASRRLTPASATHAVYLVTDLCQGGELFDRICAKSYFLEEDAAKLVRTVMGAVDYLHSHGIVHRGACCLVLATSPSGTCSAHIPLGSRARCQKPER